MAKKKAKKKVAKKVAKKKVAKKSEEEGPLLSVPGPSAPRCPRAARPDERKATIACFDEKRDARFIAGRFCFSVETGLQRPGEWRSGH